MIQAVKTPIITVFLVSWFVAKCLMYDQVVPSLAFWFLVALPGFAIFAAALAYDYGRTEAINEMSQRR